MRFLATPKLALLLGAIICSDVIVAMRVRSSRGAAGMLKRVIANHNVGSAVQRNAQQPKLLQTPLNKRQHSSTAKITLRNPEKESAIVKNIVAKENESNFLATSFFSAAFFWHYFLLASIASDYDLKNEQVFRLYGVAGYPYLDDKRGHSISKATKAVAISSIDKSTVDSNRLSREEDVVSADKNMVAQLPDRITNHGTSGLRLKRTAIEEQINVPVYEEDSTRLKRICFTFLFGAVHFGMHISGGALMISYFPDYINNFTAFLWTLLHVLSFP